MRRVVGVMKGINKDQGHLLRLSVYDIRYTVTPPVDAIQKQEQKPHEYPKEHDQ